MCSAHLAIKAFIVNVHHWCTTVDQTADSQHIDRTHHAPRERSRAQKAASTEEAAGQDNHRDDAHGADERDPKEGPRGPVDAKGAVVGGSPRRGLEGVSGLDGPVRVCSVGQIHAVEPCTSGDARYI
jgi:hypothetical protein